MLLFLIMTHAIAHAAELPEVEVRSTAVQEVEAGAPSAFVTVFEIKDRPARVEDLGAVLRESAGIQVQSLGGLGSFSTVSIRGAASGQVNVFVDGVPIGGSRLGSVDLSTFPVDGIERIEVYRGYTPAFLSPSNIGGAVNIVTKKRADAAGELKLTYGSFATRGASAFGSWTGGRLTLSGFADYAGTDGTFTYLNDNGTPLNDRDDFTDTRRNNVSNALSGSVRASYAVGPKWTLTLRDDPVWKRQGVPGTASVQSRRASYETDRNLAELRLDAGPFTPARVTVAASLSHLLRLDRFADPAGEVGIGTNRIVRGSDQTVGANVVAAAAPAEWQVVTVSAGGGYETYTPTDEIPVERDGGTSTRRTWHAVAEDTLMLFKGVLTLTPSIRCEGVDDRLDYAPSYVYAKPAENARADWSFMPALGARVQPLDWLAVKGNASRRVRQPYFYELFGDTGAVMGNPALLPETAENFDAGLSLDPGTLHLEYAYFYSRVHDLIQFMQNSQRTTMALNVGEARIAGHELTAVWTPDPVFRLTASYTYQDPRNLSPIPSQEGKQLPYRPRHSFFGRMEVTYEGFRPFYEFTFVSGNYFDPANMRPGPGGVPDRRIHNAGVEWRSPGGMWVLSVEGRNLDDGAIQDFAGYPLPGRAFYGTATLKL